MKLPAYVRYKPSGIEWLGDVPEHWDVKQLRHLTRFAYGDSLAAEDREDGPVEVFGSNGQVGTHVHGNTLAPVIVVGRKGSFGKVNFSDSSVFAIDTTYFIDRRQTKADLRWLFNLLLSLRLDAISKDSAVPGLAREDAYANSVAVPPLAEQRAIATYLDRETGRVDRLVTKKRQLIERLKEKRTALISRTVTKGLPPAAARAAGLPENPPLKPSGLDWLGDIPRHWQVLPFTKYVAEKSDYRGKTPDKQPDGVFLVTARNVRMGFIDYESSQEFIAEEDYDEVMRRGLPKQGDILFTTEAPLGNVALVDRENIALAQRIIRFRMSPARYHSAFVLFAMMSDHFQVQLKLLSTGSTAEGLKASKLPILRLIAPPLPEQNAIAAYLVEETVKLDALVAKVEEAVERLQEYRTALITAAVTGKIDVRKAIAQ